MKKYAIVGYGHRGAEAYARPLWEGFKDCAELCGVYDINRMRAELVKEDVGQDIPVFDSFEELLEKAKPDTVIVTTKDSMHDYYIVKAMRAGCDVITEKPITTTFEKVLSIQKTQEETGKSLDVIFNLRFHPLWKRAKELVFEGAIGEVRSAHYESMLDTVHGADYFRRWHRMRENSGSLLIHKCTHQFDIINWILEEDPISVNAFGTRRFYGNDLMEGHAERCYDCKLKKECPYFFDIYGDEFFRKRYFECEADPNDSYIRDACIFSNEIDIEDSVSVSVKYSKGALLSYTLTAHTAYEGIHLMLNGEKGRLEVDSTANTIRIFYPNGEENTIKVSTSCGCHGGADSNILDKLIRHRETPDPLGQMASVRAGMMSVGIGAAANISMQEGRQVSLGEYFKELK